jgi:hypothetical protein
MLEELNDDMKQSVRLVDSLYIELLTNGLGGESAKNKLISLYERMLKVNVTVIKESLDTDDLAAQLINYYCDLCHATSGLFEYLRKIETGGVISKVDVESKFNSRVGILESKIEYLEQELYQRGLEVEALESELEISNNMVIDKHLKPEHREKLKSLRLTWSSDKKEFSSKLVEKDSIIRELQNEVDKYKSLVTKLEADESTRDSSNPAKRIDVDDDVIVKMYLDGKSPYAIGKTFNMAQSGVIYRLKQAGVYVEGGRDTRGKNSSK